MSLSKKQIFGLIVFLILLAAIPVSLYLVKQQQTLKSKASSGQAPAMLKEDISLTGFNIYNPEIVDMGSGDFRYKMWFMGWPTEGTNDKVWLAVSSDLNTWCVYNGSASEKDYDCPPYDQASWKPVLEPSIKPDTWDGWHNGDPSVVWDPDTSYFYMAYTGLGTDANSKEINQSNAIGAARSKDGINWEKAGNNPVVAPNGSDTWDCQQTARPSLLKDGNRWKIYYDGYADDGKDYPQRCSASNPTKGRSQVGLMFTDSSWQGNGWQGWTRQGSEGLVMSASAEECNYVANVDVKKVGSEYKMVYDTFGYGATCQSSDPAFSRRIAEATSSDGINWTRDTKNPILQGESPWQRNEVPEYFSRDGYDYIYYGETAEQNHFRLKIKRATTLNMQNASGRIWEENNKIWMQTDQFKAGFDLRWGAALTDLVAGGKEIVNRADPGREVQVAAWDGSAKYDTCAGCSGTFGWNPVQAGDIHGHGSKVAEKKFEDHSFYTKIQPIEWYPDNKGGGKDKAVETDVTIDQWASFVPDHPNTLKLHYKITHFGADNHGSGLQEFPVVYTNKEFDRVVYYEGNSPWTNGEVTLSTLNNVQSGKFSLFASTEMWDGLVDNSGFGLVVFLPGAQPFVGGFSAPGTDGPEGSATNDISPRSTFSYGPGEALESDIYLILGNYQEARKTVYDLKQTITIPHLFDPIGHLDAPSSKNLTGVVNVGGWIIDDGISEIQVLVDNQLDGIATYKMSRKDVAKDYPGPTENSGFNYNLDTRKFPNGDHIISVVIKTTDGKISPLWEVKVQTTNTVLISPSPTPTPSPSSSPSPTPSVSPSPSPSSTWSPGPVPTINPSPSPSVTPSKRGDFNKDGKVNTIDVSILFSNWNKTNFLRETDLNSDGKINSLDFAILKSLMGK